ncbi:MAG: STAS domain-containing protein [bacterium]
MASVKELLTKYETEIYNSWISQITEENLVRKDLIDQNQLNELCKEFLTLLKSSDNKNIYSEDWKRMRDFLNTLSKGWAKKGFTSSETALFVLSVKKSLFIYLRKDNADLDTIMEVSDFIDKLSVFISESYIKSKEEIIRRQQEEMMELSTPIIKLWDGILALPLIGTLDSARTQVVMENLLNKIVETSSSIAIIDITGVPTVDTLVAQHIMKTVTAARLMGADCIISGIRPQIAQTMIHLGVSFSDIVTKATLADAIAYAFKLFNYEVKKAEN